MIQIYTVFSDVEFKLSKGNYSIKHVDRLSQMLEKHLTVPHEFNVIMSKYPGWWGKIELFQHTDMFYLDLSVAIINNIDDLVTCDTEFMACRDFVNPDLLNSKVMSWKNTDHSHVFEKFEKNADRYMEQYKGNMNMWGDQSFIDHNIGDREYWQDVFPGSIESFKLGSINDDTQIIGFHGKPKPEETEYWRV